MFPGVMGRPSMALSPKLEMRQGQQLVLTPQLQQAIKLLQLSNIELNAFVDAELERNPLLEREDHAESSDNAVVSGAADGPGQVAATPDEPGTDGWLDLSEPRGDAPAALDTEADNVYPDSLPADIDPQGAAGTWTGLRQHTNGGLGSEDHA